MKHEQIRWNLGTNEWYCTRCGRSSGAASEDEARAKLEQYECVVPSVEVAGSVPGTETVRLIRKPYKMTLRKERSACRFVVSRTDENKPFVGVELFHDTIPSLKPLTLGFEVLSGTTPEQLQALSDTMNERLVGLVVTAKDSTSK